MADKKDKTDVVVALNDLIWQATTEHSHFYTASVLLQARLEIVNLRERVETLKDFEFMYEGLCD